MKEALLVIDIDSGCGWGDNVRWYDSAHRRVAEYIEHILCEAREAHELIVFVTSDPRLKVGIAQTNYGQGTCIGCDPDWGCYLAPFLVHRHENENFEPVFIKRTANAFAHHKLAVFLSKHNVTGVRLVGCMTSACIQLTAIGAIQNGFDVTLFEKGTYPQFHDANEKAAWITDVQHYKSQKDTSFSIIIK